MKQIFSQIWFWFIMLIVFLAVIMYDRDFEKDVLTVYQKQKMHLKDVHFSEMDQGFEAARIFADEVDMDDSQSNMLATNVRSLFFDKEVATRSGELVASFASKNPQEIIFWGDVRFWSTDNERLRTDELRYATNRKELYTIRPVTLWKDNMVITGKELLYNTKSKEGSLSQNVVIRIWPKSKASSTAAIASGSIIEMTNPENPASISVIPGTESTRLPQDENEISATPPANLKKAPILKKLPKLPPTPALEPISTFTEGNRLKVLHPGETPPLRPTLGTEVGSFPHDGALQEEPKAVASATEKKEALASQPSVSSESLYENKVDSRFQRDIIIIDEKKKKRSK